MSRIFISHSSANNLPAAAMGAWLSAHTDNGWDDYFLDLDRERGLKAGERWQEQLRIRGERCEAVIFLISRAWLASKWCLAEFLLAKQLNKKIFGVLIEAVPFTDIPVEMSAEWQLCNLASEGETEAIECLFEETRHTIKFSKDGLVRLKHGLTQAGIDPRSFRFPAGRDPYHGLTPLELDDAAIFFGRDAQILRALDRMRGMRNAGPEKLMVIVGASGSGKSSFLRAGLLSRLKRDDRNFFALAPIRPLSKSISGEQGLAASLESGFASLKTPRNRGALIDSLLSESVALANALTELRDEATARLVDAAKPVTVVLPIDQGEELLDGSDEPNRLIDLLIDACSDTRLRSGTFLALLTIRSDRFEGLQKHSRLRGLATAEFGLPPIPITSYREIIERPAAVFEHSGGKLNLKPDFVETLAADAAKGGADAFPLLAFTLQRLYSLYGKDGNLTLGEYDTMGRMEGAIAVAVNEAVPPAEQHRLRHAFIPHLAVVDPKTLEPRRKKARLARLPDETRPLIEKMVATRLLIVDQIAGDTVVELAHDSLLGAWKDLRGWLREDQALLALNETTREAAEDWSRDNRNSDRLIHRGTPLKESEALLARPDLIDDVTREYLRACRLDEDKDAQEKLDAINRERAQLRRTQLFQRYTAGALFAGLAAVLLGGWLVVALTASSLDTRARIVADAAMGQSSDHFDSSLRLALLASRTANRAPIEASTEATIREVAKFGSKHGDASLGSILSHSALARALQGTLQVAVLRGHLEDVVDASFSLDGRRVVTASNDGTARLWDAQGKPLAVLKGHKSAVTSVALSAYGGRIVTASKDKTARLWDAQGKELAVLRGHKGEVTFANFSPDGSRIVTVSRDKTARLWDAQGTELAVLRVREGSIYCAAFNLDGSRIVTGSADSTARLWDVQGKELAVLRGHQRPVMSVAFSPDNSRILTGSTDNTARLWDAQGNELAVLNAPDGRGLLAAFSPDGRRLVTRSLYAAHLWDVQGNELAVLRGHDDIVRSATFNTDGSRIVTASLDKTARVWDARGKELAVLKGHEGGVLSALFSPDGSHIVTASTDNTARIWDVKSKEPAVLTGHTDVLQSAVFSPDGSRLVTASDDGTARLWDAQGKALAVLKGHEGSVASANFSPDSNRIVTASDDGTARLWDTQGKELAALSGHADRISFAIFSPDGSRIVTASRDSTARLWDTQGREIAEFRKHYGSPVLSADFSPDGSRIVTGSTDKTARVWDAQGKELIVLKHEGGVSSVAFSPDGSRIVTASGDRTARLWDVQGKALAVLRGHEGYIVSAAFNRDGSRILTASWDNTARLWDAQGKELAVLRGHEASIWSAAFSLDNRIVTTSQDNTARLWDAQGKELAVLKGHEGGTVTFASFSPDGNHIVTASDDKTARLWDISRATDPHFEELAKMACQNYLNGASEPSLEELRLVGLENEFETMPDLCAEFR